MRLTLIGADDAPNEALALAAALEAEGFTVTRHALRQADGEEATAALVGALRESETLLAGEPPQATVIAGEGDLALAAALVAVKLEIPTAWIGPPVAQGALPLAARIAHLALDATAPAPVSAAAITGIAAPTLPQG